MDTQSEISQPGEVTHGDVHKYWPIATQAVIVEQPSLGIILAGSTIREIKNNQITLAVRFPMYREKLMEIKVKQRIENRLSELCGQTRTYLATYIPEEQDREPEVSDIIDTFGGRVVA